MPKLKIIIASLLSVVLVASVAVFSSLLFRFWDPMWNPFRPSPEEVIAAMAKNMEGLDSCHMKGDLTAKFSYSYVGIKMKTGYEADIDRTDENSVKINTKTKISFNPLASFTAEGMAIGENTYVKITKFSSLYGSEEDLGIEKGQWIKYGENWRGNLDNEIEKGKSVYPSGSSLESKISIFSMGKPASDGMDQTAILKILSNGKFYSSIKELPEENIGDGKAYHYQIVFDPEIIKPIILEVAQARLAGKSESEDESLEDSIDSLFESIEELSGEIWIGKKDNLPYKLKISETSFDYVSGLGIAAGLFDSYGESVDGVEAEGQIEFSDYHKKLEISVPIGADKAEDAIIESFSATSPAQRAAKNATIKSYMDQMKSTAAIIYNNNTPNNYAGLADNEEFKTIKERIEESSGNALVVKISGGGYCAYAKLLTGKEEDSSYWCIDGSGYSGYGGGDGKDPSQKGYCDGATFNCD